MTRKDFELIARVLRANNSSRQLAEAFASALKSTNQQFNPKKFLEAAGVANAR